MRKPAPLTPLQREAIELAERQGGKLFRNDVAWGPKKFDPKTTPFADLYSFRTVQSLCTRGALRWSAPGEVEIVRAAA